MRMTPVVQGKTLTWYVDTCEQQLTVGTPAWYTWLENASLFAFVGEMGTFTARKEPKPHGGPYWKAYRKREGRLYHAYLGKSQKLSLERLNAIAAVLARRGEGVEMLPVLGPDEETLHMHAESSDSSEPVGRQADSSPAQTAGPQYLPHEVDVMNIHPSNLPVPLTTLIGREQERAVICSLLRRPEVRLVTLTGTPGIGKTRLGIEVASMLRTDFADGVYFVNLAPLSDPALVIATIAQTLDVKETAARPLLDRLRAFLGEKQLLLLLDNFEQVISAAVRLAELLATCPQLKALVTSRAALRVRGEQEFAVPPLAVPDPKCLPDVGALSEYEAVALFLQRAQALKPAFQVTSANAPAIAEICVRLDGLPLAIELAATRIKLFPPQTLLTRLSHRLTVLTSGTRDAPARQQTLRNTIEWSYNLLDVSEQRLFRRLSVFVRGCTLQAIEAVCAALGDEAGSVLNGVASLIDKSLVQQIEQEEEPRFMMLETIREYGQECLEGSGEMEMTQQAHASYYLVLAEEAEPKLYGTEQQAWFDRLEQEHENLRAALHWLLERKEAEMALRLCVALCWFWEVHRDLSEGQQFLERALSGSEAVTASVRAAALNGVGWLAYFQKDYKLADALLRESLALFQALGDKRGVAMSLRRLGMLAWREGNYVAASALAEKALTIFKEVDYKRGIAYPLLLLAYVATSEGEYMRASTLLEECLSIFRQLDDKRTIAVVLHRLAEAVFAQGDYMKASLLVEESLTLAKKVGDKETIPNSLDLSGRLALHQGDAAKARSLLEEYLAFSRESGNPWYIADSLSSLAGVLAFQGDYVAAHTLYEESLAIARKIGSKSIITYALEGLAGVVAAQGKLTWAARLWGTAASLRETIGTPLSPVERTAYEQAVAAVRTQLQEKAFSAAWSEGRTMTLEHVLTAQGPVTMLAPIPAEPSTVPHAPKAPTYPDGLTTREVEVMCLVAQGLSDAQVANQLVLSRYTVSTHLHSIYNKLGVTSRAAATRFAVEHHLV